MSVIDDYLATINEPQKSALEHVRQLVKQTVPKAEEVISYGMPGFKYKGKYMIGFASFKDHMSIFPTSTPTEALEDRLKAFKTSKGTIQFTITHPIPDELVKEIVLYKVGEIDKTK